MSSDMSVCNEYRDRLLDHAMGGLPTAALAAHLKSCPTCAGELQRRQVRGAKLDTELRRIANPDPPSYLATRIAARAHDAPAWRPRVAIAALLLAVIAAGTWLVSARRDRHAATAAAAISRWRSPTASLLQPPSQPIYKESFHE